MIKQVIKLINNINAWINPYKVGYVIFYLTNRCNFRCDFCFYYAEIEKGRKDNELTLVEIEKISKSTGSLLQLSMTGGEPFVREDFTEITNIWIKNTKVRFITIPTNAWLTDKMLKYLEQVLPQNPDTYFRIAFSIDGIGDDHDKNRSKPGSYSKLVESYNIISPLRSKYKNLILDSNTVFTSITAPKIIEILNHINDNFQFDNLTVTYARGDIKDPNLLTYESIKYKEMNELLNSLERKKEKRFLYPLYRGVRDVAWKNLIKTIFEDKFVTPCVAGKKLIIISETGEVKPCEILLDKSMGNLKDFNYDLNLLMKTNLAKNVGKWIVKTKCKCSFECALAANVTWNYSQYPRLFFAAFNNIGVGWRDNHKKIINKPKKIIKINRE